MDEECWPPGSIGDVRTKELLRSLEILGVQEHRWLGFPDGGCAALDLATGAEAVATVLRDVRPDTVVTFSADGQTGHPDHIAVHHWCVAAVRATGIGTLHVVANTAEWLEEFQTPLNQLGALVGDPPTAWTGPLSVELVLGDDLLARKLAALGAQTSQTEAFRTAVGEDFYRRAFSIERFGILAV